MDHIIHKQQGEELTLLREKALIWEKKSTLILADLHLGKITHFRKAGIALPKAAEKDNFDRFSYLLLNHDVQEIIILGDLFHSDYNDQWPAFIEFIGHFPELHFHLVLGNHDILSADNYISTNLTTHSTYSAGPFIFTHKPEDHDGYYNMCGHIHPSIIMNGKGLQRLRLPCFHFTHNKVIFPAFGAFTGTYNVSPIEEDHVFVTTDQSIIKVL